MTESTSPNGPGLRTPTSGGFALPAWLVLTLLLAAEYLTFSYLFDARDLLGPAGIGDIDGAGSLGVLGFVVAATTLITGGAAPKAALASLASWRSSRSALALFASTHALLFPSALFVTARVVQSTEIALARGLFVGAAILGGAALASAALTFFEGRRLLQVFATLRRALSIGVGVGVVAWAAGLLAAVLWKPLAWGTLELVHALLTVLAEDPVASVEHELVGTSRFFVHIAPVCSGVEGIGLMLSFVTAFLYVERARLRWPVALALLPASVVFIWLLNVLRITGLIAVGTWLSPSVALGGFHSKAGWVLFTGAALGIVLFVRESALFARVPPASLVEVPAKGASTNAPTSASLEPRPRPSGESAYLLPLLSVLAVALVSGLATADFDHFYPLRVVVAGAILYRFRSSFPRWRLRAAASSAAWGGLLGVLWIVGFRAPAPVPEGTLGTALAALPPVWAGIWLGFRVIGTVVFVPVVEELAFRGYLLRRLTREDFETVAYEHSSWFAWAASSLAFGFLHSQWLLGVVAGLLFGLLAKLRGGLADAVLAHATANLVLVAYALGTGEWALLG